MGVLQAGTTARAVFSGTDIPGYLFGMVGPAPSTVSGYIESSLRGSGYFSGVVAAVTYSNVTVTVTLSRAMDSSAVLEAIRFALINSYVDTSQAQVSFNVMPAGTGVPVPTNYGGFITEFTGQIGSNTGALVSTGFDAALQGIAATLGISKEMLLIGGGALLLVVLIKSI